MNRKKKVWLGAQCLCSLPKISKYTVNFTWFINEKKKKERADQVNYYYVNIPMQYTCISVNYGCVNRIFAMNICDIMLIFVSNIDFRCLHHIFQQK